MVMAQKITLVCDACAREKDVVGYDLKKGTGERFHGDLCPRCWNRMIKEFGPKLVTQARRRRYEVMDFEAIPRTKE
jgi:hypothetical protein